LVYVSQISSENGHHSNVIQIFRSDRSEAQMFCVSFNNLTGLAVLMESAHCFLPMFRHVSQSGQTLGNISEKHRETSNVSEFARLGNIFASREANFVSATMFPRVGKQGHI
jgi:hypothetical protein